MFKPGSDVIRYATFPDRFSYNVEDKSEQDIICVNLVLCSELFDYIFALICNGVVIMFNLIIIIIIIIVIKKTV